MNTSSTWELIDAEVREYSVNGDQRAKDLFIKAIAAAEARGYARAKERALVEIQLEREARDEEEVPAGVVIARIRALKDEGGE